MPILEGFHEKTSDLPVICLQFEITTLIYSKLEVIFGNRTRDAMSALRRPAIDLNFC